MNNYNEQNKHERDGFLHFETESHKYTVNGDFYKSVTTLIDEQFEQFDADKWAAIKAPSLGMTPEEVKEMWRAKGEKAACLGTQLHADIESFYLGEPQPTTDSAYDHFRRFAEQYHLQPFRTEWAIYDEASRIAGTLDMLDYQNGVFTIYDWKRSNKIVVGGTPEKESRWGKRAKAPIAHIPDTTFWHYALQQSAYRYILEKNYGIHVAQCNLVVLHPDYIRPYVVEVPYLREEVKTLFGE